MSQTDQVLARTPSCVVFTSIFFHAHHFIFSRTIPAKCRDSCLFWFIPKALIGRENENTIISHRQSQYQKIIENKRAKRSVVEISAKNCYMGDKIKPGNHWSLKLWSSRMSVMSCKYVTWAFQEAFIAVFSSIWSWAMVFLVQKSRFWWCVINMFRTGFRTVMQKPALIKTTKKYVT